MEYCRVEGLGKTYSDFDLEASLSCSQGEQIALLGPSGSGKTTLLRIMAGLIRPDRGRLVLAGKDITGLPARHRGVGLVFQDFALFPHLDVGGNVAYGLRLKGLKGRELEKRVADLLERFALPGFARRKVGTLSGGERQRVALARALAVEPDLMLFDEPLASLDALLRRELRAELRQIQRRLGFTSVLVTHDQEDALSSADRVAVMHQGRVMRLGTPEEIYQDPQTIFVAGFVGAGNVLTCRPGMPWFQGGHAEGSVFLRPEFLVPGKPGPGEFGVKVLVHDREYQGRSWLGRGRLELPGLPALEGLQFYTGLKPEIGTVMDLKARFSDLRNLLPHGQ